CRRQYVVDSRCIVVGIHIVSINEGNCHLRLGYCTSRWRCSCSVCYESEGPHQCIYIVRDSISYIYVCQLIRLRDHSLDEYLPIVGRFWSSYLRRLCSIAHHIDVPQ